MDALIVDDQPSALMLMRAILDRAGYHVVECSRGEKAINELSKGRFDLVIMDLNLPDISGMDVLQSPELAPKPLPPVVGITGALTPQVEERAIAAGMCRVLEKPISYEQLIDAAAVAIKIGRSVRREEDDDVPVIDPSTLADVRAVREDDALPSRFVNVAIADARRCLADLQAATRRQDLSAWRTHAQTLDGVALTFGARRLARSISSALTKPDEQLRGALPGLDLHFAELLDEAQDAVYEWLANAGGDNRYRRSLQSKRRVPHSLTERELSVLRWTAAGKTSAEIGIILGISTRTVNFHITTALTKLDAVNKTQAVVKAVMLGLLVVDGISGDEDEPKEPSPPAE